MASSALNPVVAWFSRLTRRGRLQYHRRFYARYVAEEPRTLDERVAFHLHHLGLYWSRCLGSLEAFRPVGPSFLGGDWMIMVLVGTEAAAPDVVAYCAETGAAELSAAWERYARALVRARRGLPEVEAALRAAAEDYARVQQAHAAAASAAGRRPGPAV